MLAFIDESGHPRPSDSTSRPVLLAVCIQESDVGQLMRVVFSMKRSLLSGLSGQREEREGKATKLLNRYSLTKVAPKREFADSLFEFLRDFELTVFAIVMEKPVKTPYQGPDFLQTQFRWLLERIDRFMEVEHLNYHAIPIFDGQDPTNNRIFSDCFTRFMSVTEAGRAMKHIVPSPMFVDSSLTPGIQIADLFAYVTRLNYENMLHQTHMISDPYLSAIKRYAGIVRSKTRNYTGEDGQTSYGIRTMDVSKFAYDAPTPVAENTASPDPDAPPSGIQSS